MLQAGNPGNSRDVCDYPALLLTNNHPILKCLLASYSTLSMAESPTSETWLMLRYAFQSRKIGQLKWESLKKRRKDNRLILLYKGLKGKARIPTDDLIPKVAITEESIRLPCSIYRHYDPVHFTPQFYHNYLTNKE